MNIDENVGKNHDLMAKKMRKRYYYRNLEPMNINDLSMFPNADTHPIVFAEIFQLNTSMHMPSQVLGSTTQGVHLFVLCHGF